jgi:hypothetical protein
MDPQEPKHKLLKPLLIILLGIILVGTTGFGVWYWQQNELKKQKTDSDKQISELKKQINDLKKESTIENSTGSTGESNEEKAGAAETLGTISAGATATKSPDDQTISILFYPDSTGIFTSQEKQGSGWVNVIANKSYPGHGGFNAGTIPAGGSVKTVRLLLVENGKNVATSKEFTINRSEVESAGGIKSYE